MRILHIEKTPRCGGVGSFLSVLTAAQVRRGHEVEVFGCAEGEADGRRSGRRPSFVDFTAASAWAWPRMVHSVAAANDLAAFLHGRRFEVAHLHNIYHHLTPSILPVLARRRMAIVMTVHDYRLSCPAKHFVAAGGLCTRCAGGRFYRAASSQCGGLRGAGLAAETYVQAWLRRYATAVDLFLCPTRYMRDVLAGVHLPKSKLRVVPNPVDVPGAAARPADGGCIPATAGSESRYEQTHGASDALAGALRTDDFDFLYLGRLSGEKAPELMLELARALPAARVALAGEGPEAPSLRARAGELRLANVTFLGAVDRAGVARLLGRSACVVLTSRCMENSPLAMLEAMAAGRCVLVPDQRPLREWVRDGVTGRTYAASDVGALVAAAGELLADAAWRRRMGERARRLVEGRHEAGAVAEAVDEAYDEARRRCALRW